MDGALRGLQARPLVVGRDRDAGYAAAFMDDLASRLANRMQFTTDGHSVYLNAVGGALGGDVDYAMLVKLYGPAPEAEAATARRGAPGPVGRS